MLGVGYGGFVALSPVVLAEFFGVDRLVLGTNYPYGPEEGCVLVKNSLKAIDGLELNEPDKEKILGGNAQRILGLGGL